MKGTGRALILGLVIPLAGCAVRPPGRLETSLAEQVKRNITVRGKQDNNPLPDTAGNIQAGRQNFSHYCMVCHGLDGQNTGVPFAEKMSPPVPLLTSPAVQSYSDGEVRYRRRQAVRGREESLHHW